MLRMSGWSQWWWAPRMRTSRWPAMLIARCPLPVPAPPAVPVPARPSAAEALAPAQPRGEALAAAHLSATPVAANTR